MTSLLSFLITIFLLKSTLPRELKRVSFAESFMQGMQKVFNAGFNFLMVTSDTVFNVMQILLLNLYPPVEKKGFTVSTKGFSVELSTGIAMMKHGSSTVHIKTVLCRHRF